MENLLIGDEKKHLADKPCANDKLKRVARTMGIYCGILDKSKRGKRLSGKQQKRNRQKSGVRAAVEHPFAFMHKKLKIGYAAAKTMGRNALRFDMWCILI